MSRNIYYERDNKIIGLLNQYVIKCKNYKVCNKLITYSEIFKRNDFSYLCHECQLKYDQKVLEFDEEEKVICPCCEHHCEIESFQKCNECPCPEFPGTDHEEYMHTNEPLSEEWSQDIKNWENQCDEIFTNHHCHCENC